MQHAEKEHTQLTTENGPRYVITQLKAYIGVLAG